MCPMYMAPTVAANALAASRIHATATVAAMKGLLVRACALVPRRTSRRTAPGNVCRALRIPAMAMALATMLMVRAPAILDTLGHPVGTNVPGVPAPVHATTTGNALMGLEALVRAAATPATTIRTAAMSALEERRTRGQGMIDAARFMALVPARHLMQGTGQAATAVPLLLGTTAPVVLNARNAGTGHATRA